MRKEKVDSAVPAGDENLSTLSRLLQSLDILCDSSPQTLNTSLLLMALFLAVGQQHWVWIGQCVVNLFTLNFCNVMILTT